MVGALSAVKTVRQDGLTAGETGSGVKMASGKPEGMPNLPARSHLVYI